MSHQWRYVTLDHVTEQRMCLTCSLPVCVVGTAECPIVQEQKRLWQLNSVPAPPLKKVPTPKVPRQKKPRRRKNQRPEYQRERHLKRYQPVTVDRRGGYRPGAGRKPGYTTRKEGQITMYEHKRNKEMSKAGRAETPALKARLQETDLTQSRYRLQMSGDAYRGFFERLAVKQRMRQRAAVELLIHYGETGDIF